MRIGNVISGALHCRRRCSFAPPLIAIQEAPLPPVCRPWRKATRAARLSMELLTAGPPDARVGPAPTAAGRGRIPAFALLSALETAVQRARPQRQGSNAARSGAGAAAQAVAISAEGAAWGR